MTAAAALMKMVESRAGLDGSVLGQTSLKRAMEKRMDVCSIHNAEAYVKKAEDDSMEWNELVEELVVPETWFFRDEEPFKCLAAYALSKVTRQINISSLSGSAAGGAP